MTCENLFTLKFNLADVPKRVEGKDSSIQMDVCLSSLWTKNTFLPLLFDSDWHPIIAASFSGYKKWKLKVSNPCYTISSIIPLKEKLTIFLKNIFLLQALVWQYFWWRWLKKIIKFYWIVSNQKASSLGDRHFALRGRVCWSQGNSLRKFWEGEGCKALPRRNALCYKGMILWICINYMCYKYWFML